MAFSVTARHTYDGGTTDADNITTASATPTADSLFIAFYGAEANFETGDPTMDVPSGGGLTYTSAGVLGISPAIPWDASPGYRVGGRIAYAPVGSSPSAFGVSCEANSGSTSTYWYQAVCADVTGYNTSSPIVQTASNSASLAGVNNPSGTVTLSSVPTSGNLLVVAIFAAADTGGAFGSVTAGSGKTTTTITAQSNSGYTHAGMWYRVCDGTESTTVTCSDLGTSVGAYVAFALEIAPDGGGTGDATVTPPMVAGLTAVGAPTVLATGNATVTPATVQAVAVMDAATGAVAETATPATVAATATLGAPAVQTTGNTTVTPATVAAVSTVETPAVSAGSNATVTPATVAATAAVPTPTVAAPSNALVEPAIVAAPATVGSPALVADLNVTVAPARVQASASVGGPAVLVLEPMLALTPPTQRRRYGDHGLWGRIWHTVGLSIVVYADGRVETAVESPSIDRDTVVAVYDSGRTYMISADDAAPLIDAGYGEHLEEVT